jgi:hypothetical protein
LSRAASDFENQSIESLQAAADLIREAVQLLQANKANYQATNLPVEVAVSHVLSCLDKDAAYLNQLAQICSDSAPMMRKFDNE